MRHLPPSDFPEGKACHRRGHDGAVKGPGSSRPVVKLKTCLCLFCDNAEATDVPKMKKKDYQGPLLVTSITSCSSPVSLASSPNQGATPTAEVHAGARRGEAL